jgi:hypothetical protein
MKIETMFKQMARQLGYDVTITPITRKRGRPAKQVITKPENVISIPKKRGRPCMTEAAKMEARAARTEVREARLAETNPCTAAFNKVQEQAASQTVGQVVAQAIAPFSGVPLDMAQPSA